MGTWGVSLYARVAAFVALAAAAGVMVAGCGRRPAGKESPAAQQAASGAAALATIPSEQSTGAHALADAACTGHDAVDMAAEAPKTPASVAAKAKPGEPRIVWTGSGFLVVWLEGGGGKVAYSDTYSHRVLYGDDGGWPVTTERPAVRMAAFDSSGEAAGDPVTLGGAGDGPASMTGPAFTDPLWHDGALWLGWSLCRDGEPHLCRYVVGRWSADGTQSWKPVVLGKDGIRMFALRPALVANSGGVAMSWMSVDPPRLSGCRLDCGPAADSVKEVSVSATGAPGQSRHLCGEVLFDFDVRVVAGRSVYLLHDEHVGCHTTLHPPDGAPWAGEHWESQAPFKGIVASTGAGIAYAYDLMDDEYDYAEHGYKVLKHCLAVVRAEGTGENVECARMKSSSLAIPEQGGLAVAFTTKEGDVVTLPFAKGDHVPPAMIAKAHAFAGGVSDAVWTGTAIAVTWAKGKKVRLGFAELPR